MNYAKIMENGTVRISSIKKDGYKPLAVQELILATMKMGV